MHIRKQLGWFCFTIFISSAAFGQTQPPPEMSVSSPLTITPQQPASSAQASTQAATIETAGQMVWVNGTVKATYPEQAPRVLTRGSVLYEKDTIATATDGSGEIAFTDNSILTLRPNTTFVIEHYYFNQANPSTPGQYIMNLIEGGFRTITGFVAKAQPESYKVKTPVATIGVRGTEYQVNCVVSGGCATGLTSGAIAVSNQAGTLVLTTQHPYAVIPSATQAPVLTNTLPAVLQKMPKLTPPSAPQAPGGAKGGNCGIVIQ